jgi:hypothetical protein
MAKQPIDLLAIAKSMDPGFGENMPQEVADAFANGDVARVFRTHSQLGQKKEALKHDLFSGKTLGEGGDWHGGSIYVQTKDGRTARFKGSSSSVDEYDPVNQPGVTDAGWNSTKGRGAFAYDKTGLYDPDSKAYQDSVASLSPKGDSTEGTYAAARASSRDIAPMTGDQMLGLRTFEYNDDMSLRHTGSPVTEVFESSGQRHFYGSTEETDIYGRKYLQRGDKSSEPVSDYMARKGIKTPTPTVPVKDKAQKVSQNVATKPVGKPAVSSGEEADDVLDESPEKKEPASVAKDASKDVAKEASKESDKTKAEVVIQKTVKDILNVKTKEEKESETEDQTAVDQVGEKVQEKLADTVKGKVEDKVKEVLGDSQKGKEELADVVIDAFNNAAAKRKGGVTVGQATAQVSTTIVGSANSSPVTPVMPTGATASAANTVSTAGTTSQSQRIAQGAGRSVAPPTSALPSTTTAPKVGGMTDELLDYGRQVSRAVLDGVKGSKNIRMLGMASLVGAAGWIAGKKKDAVTQQARELNRQNAIRDSLMSDG